MRKFAIKSAAPSGEGEVRPSDDGGQGWFRKEWRLVTLVAIILMAFVIRFVFAYGISAGDNYALSGGTSASSHLNTIISILSGNFSTTNSSLNYPVGTLSVYPPLMDIILSGVAGVVSLFGVSTATAAAGTLAWSAPIFAALTCYPVYLVAKKMFDDEKIGILASLLYATFALLIMTTVFSNGTEYAFVGFLFAWMVYFLLGSMDGLDKAGNVGFNTLLSDRTLLKNTVLAGLLFAMIALSWNQFRVILVCLVILMFAQALLDRVRSKDFSLVVGVYSVVILMGVLISAPYYVASGLWTEVFSGVLLIGVISVLFALVFTLTSKKSWVLMIPALLIVFAVVLIALCFGANDLYTAFVYGNSYYEGSLMQALMSGSNTMMSTMAAYYGWFTFWCPLMLFAWMVYRIPKHLDSRKYLFTMMFVLVMFILGWYTTSRAVIAGIAFAAASSAVLVFIWRKVDLRSYFSSIRGGDFKSKLKKIGKPIPLALTILLVIVVVAPNITYAIDAAIPTNSESDDGYFGGLGYTISTTDSSSMNELWSSYSDEEKSGALVTWLSYSNDAVNIGGFESVTDTLGGGTSAMANIILADGSSGATAAMIVRILLSNDLSDFKSIINGSGLDYGVIEGYVNDPQSAISTINSNMDEYPGYNSSITEENALYVVIAHYITSNLCEPDVDSLYDSICDQAGQSITYVAVNGSMIPIYYGDSSSFSSIAYFNDYLVGDYGAISQFFSYSTSTGYASYTDEMYETFLWKSLIGVSASYYGYSSTTSFLSALALSDGTVKAIPGYGLSNYTVAYWTVMYNADSDATLSSDGWVEMDGYEAIALQEEQGGLINYLSGVVLLEYDSSGTETVNGTVEYTTSSGTEAAAEGVEVAVYTLKEGKYVPTCVVTTLSDGSYSISVPTDGTSYYITISSGATTTTGGTVIETFESASSLPSTYVISSTSLSGTVVSDDEAYAENMYVVIEGQTSGLTYQCGTTNGTFSFSGILPDKYTVTVYLTDGTKLTSQDVSVCVGNNVGAMIDADSGTITVTVTDEYGNSVDSGTIVATDTTTGYQFTSEIEDGKAVLNVVPSTYTLSAMDGKVMLSVSSSITVSSGGSKTSSVTVYDSKNITVSGAPSGSMITVSSSIYVASSSTSTTFEVPVSGASTGEVYTAYAVVGGTVYYGCSTGSTISLSSSTAYTVTGVLTNSDSDKVSGGTVSYILSSGVTFTFTTDDYGNYTAVLPAGSYTVYAYDEDGSAYLGAYTISSDAEKDISMVASRSITATLDYYTQLSSSGTKGLAFVDVTFTATINSVEYVVVLITDSDGKACFYVPTDCTATASIEGFDTDEFYCTAQEKSFDSSTSSQSVTWKLSADPSDDEDMHVQLVTVYSEYEITLTLYIDSGVTYTFSGYKEVMVGRYTAVVEGSTGYYFDGTVYVYAGQSSTLDMDGVEVATVTLKADTNDVITITAVKDDDGNTGEYYVDGDDEFVYYVEKGYDYYFTAKSASSGTEYIAYGSVLSASSDVTLNLSDKAEAVTITGYVGVAEDGSITMSYDDVSIAFSVTSGEFKITVPKGQAMKLTAEVTQENSTYDEITYTYTSTVNLLSSAVVDGTVVNMASTTSSVEDDTVLSGSDCSFSDGVGSFVLAIENDGTSTNTYIITGGDAWVLYQTYTLTVAAGSTGHVTIYGFYDADSVGAGNSGLYVTVTDVSGNSIGNYVLDGSGFSGTSSDTYVDVSGTDGASDDAVTTYEYLYAVTITNNDCFMKTATITATTDSGWTIVITDGDQYLIYESGSSFDVMGYTTTTIYVKVICSDGTSTDVPDVNITVSMSGVTLKTNSSDVSISGSTATMVLSPQDIDLESSDMSASGTNIYNSQASVPMFFWVLMALSVLGLIFIVWTGSKRGVFARRK